MFLALRRHVCLAGALYGLDPRGRGYHEIRRRLLDALLLEAA